MIEPWKTNEYIIEELKKLYDGKRSGMYLAGSLDMPLGGRMGSCLNVESRSFQFQRDSEDKYQEIEIEMTPDLNYWICKLYVQNKSKSHAFYKQAQEVISVHPQ